MPTATIIPRYVNPPKNPGWPANIKDGDGGYWSFKPAQIPLESFTVGQEITFDWLPENSKDGREFRVIKRVHNPHSQGAHPGPAPGPKPQNGVGFRPSMAPKDALEAKITLICAGYAQAGIVPSPQDVETLILNVTRGVTMATPKPSPQRADDMADEIPY